MPRQINIVDVTVGARPVEEGGRDQSFQTAQGQGVTAAIPWRLGMLTRRAQSWPPTGCRPSGVRDVICGLRPQVKQRMYYVGWGGE